MKRPTPNDIILEARSYLGTPVRHQGRKPGTALDCVGVLASICKQFHYPHKDLVAYDRYPDGSTLMALMSGHFDEVSKDETRDSDILVFNFDGRPSHVGIKTDIGVLHAWLRRFDGRSRVVEHGLSTAWLSRWSHTFRWKESKWRQLL